MDDMTEKIKINKKRAQTIKNITSKASYHSKIFSKNIT